MPREIAGKTEPRLTLKSRLDDLAAIWPWIESLAAEYHIPAETQFAMDLCLEEALSNVIRHGYAGRTDRPITIEFKAGSDGLALTIEDHAPPFDPLADRAIEHAPATSSIEEIPLGGRGILLMKKFAGSLEYRRLDGSNRFAVAER
jgi:anti-sigma regulatory factor (Ser/Thr protein kinase)